MPFDLTLSKCLRQITEGTKSACFKTNIDNPCVFTKLTILKYLKVV